MIKNKKIDSPSVAEFLIHMNYKPNHKIKILKKEIYKQYKSYCESKKLYTISEHIFGNQLRQYGYKVDKYGSGGFTYVWATSINKNINEDLTPEEMINKLKELGYTGTLNPPSKSIIL